jgi:hypothetical protein
VTVRVRLHASAATEALTSLAAPALVSRTPTTLTFLPGDSRYVWNVQRVTTTSGTWWRTQADQTPVPPAPPPGGYACGVAYQNYLGSQINCYEEWAGTEMLLPFYEAAMAAYGASIGCAGSLLIPGTGAVAYLRCVGAFAGVGFVKSILVNVFGIEGGSMGGASYHSESCSSIERARISIQQYCQQPVGVVVP